MLMSIDPFEGRIPDVVVVGFFAEAGSDGCALLLDHCALVGDGLCCADIANELLDCNMSSVSSVLYADL